MDFRRMLWKRGIVWVEEKVEGVSGRSSASAGLAY
jgi:hypothetical protein